jgi:hypothetical protein
MRDIVFVYMLGKQVMSATLHGFEADRFEAGLGDRLLGKVILEAK